MQEIDILQKAMRVVAAMKIQLGQIMAELIEAKVTIEDYAIENATLRARIVELEAAQS